MKPFQFRGFGHVEVRLATDDGDRSAFVYFCSDNDASDAFEANFDIVFNELKAVVRPFYEEASTGFIFLNKLTLVEKLRLI